MIEQIAGNESWYDIADEVSCDPEFEERQRDIEQDRVEMAIDEYQENKGEKE